MSNIYFNRAWLIHRIDIDQCSIFASFQAIELKKCSKFKYRPKISLYYCRALSESGSIKPYRFTSLDMLYHGIKCIKYSVNVNYRIPPSNVKCLGQSSWFSIDFWSKWAEKIWFPIWLEFYISWSSGQLTRYIYKLCMLYMYFMLYSNIVEGMNYWLFILQNHLSKIRFIEVQWCFGSIISLLGKFEVGYLAIDWGWFKANFGTVMWK